jgi:16S rRNA processing protein RimM
MTAPHGSGEQPEAGAVASGQWILLARIRRPQGRKGEVIADILTDFPEKFTERKQLWLLPEASGAGGASSAPRQATLESHWLHKGGVVLHFSGVDSITAAESLAGLIVAIPEAERAVLGEDEVYIADLVGCALVDVAGALPVTVGEIVDVDRTAGPVSLLVVRGQTDEILVPFAKNFLRRMDIAGKQVEMALPEGLTDLNAPEKA